MKKNIYYLIAACYLLASQSTAAQKKLTALVNPFIGTGAVDAHSLSGSNFPAATTPFGFIQLGPDTQDVPDQPCSGYDYYAKSIVGFSHNHLSGTGVPDLFDVLMMPSIGQLITDTSKVNFLEKGFRSRFSHAQESAKPGYYQVNLLDYNINVELTASAHVGFHRYTFPKNEKSHVFFDLNHSYFKERSWYPCKIVSQIRVIDNKTIEGYRIITAWAEGFRKVYFRAEFSKPFVNYTLLNGARQYENIAVTNGNNVKAILDFNTAANEQVLVKVGLSAVSLENARMNMAAEVPHWDFEQTARQADAAWEKELQCISIEGTKEQKEIFYTGLYHAFTQPNNMADVNGDYPATDMVVRNAANKVHYTTFSLWDTYRAANPLYTLVQPKRVGEFITSMMRQYDTYGFLPLWQMWGLENYCMIGNHSIPVIVDAALKGIDGFDVEKAYEAAKGSSIKDHLNSPVTAWEKYGYIPEDVQSQSVSITLETAFDDWCVAQLAKKLGKTEDYNRFMKRSQFYKNLYDTKTQFFRAKTTQGNWLEPFNPLEYGGNGGNPYTEGNAWQYLFYAPQDMPGLITLLGGREAFCAKLDAYFTLKNMPSEKNNNASGFIGQYAHGNEPSHHVTYMYDYAGQPWKTQKYVSQVLNELYNNSFSGYAGNEDCGQMASWYIFSSMGFYPVNPANGVYAIGSPILKSAVIHLANGKEFKVVTQNASKENPYIQSVKLNGKKYTKTFITQPDIANGGILEFEMGSKPNKKWGTSPTDAPAAWGY